MSFEIIITTGAPLSGKSTWAKKYVWEHPGWVRVCRDDIRAMLNGGDPFRHFKTEREKDIEVLTKYIRDDAVYHALFSGQNVVLDETNLRSQAFYEMVDICQTTTFADKVCVREKKFYISKENALKRNKLRIFSVPEEVLDKMWEVLGGEEFKNYKPQKKVIPIKKWGACPLKECK